MIKLALAAGVTLSILCGFMTLRNSFPNLLGGTGGSGGGGLNLNSITNALSGSGSSGLSSFSLFTNSDSSSSSSGSGYLPPQGSSKYLPPNNQPVENSTSGFRIFITPTPKPTTASPSNISTTNNTSAQLRIENSTSSENEVENSSSTVAPVKTVTSTTSLATSSSLSANTTQLPSSPAPIVMMMMADTGKSAALGEGGISKPPPTTVTINNVTTNVNSVETENKIGMNQTEYIRKPENMLKPPNPNALYLPPAQ